MSLLEQDYQEGADIWECYETYKNAAIYTNETQLEFEFDLCCHDFRYFDLAKLDPSKLCHVSTTSSALQATTARGAYGRVVASYQQYEYNDNLSEGLSVINNTTKTTWVKGCQLLTMQV